jgi:hypothetical protein
MMQHVVFLDRASLKAKVRAPACATAVTPAIPGMAA